MQPPPSCRGQPARVRHETVASFLEASSVRSFRVASRVPAFGTPGIGWRPLTDSAPNACNSWPARCTDHDGRRHGMQKNIGPNKVVDLSTGRRAWLNALDLGAPQHVMYGLMEVDVPVAKRFIADHKASTGETLSFTGFIVACLARAVDENKAVQAYRKGGRQLVVFDDVNVG